MEADLAPPFRRGLELAYDRLDWKRNSGAIFATNDFAEVAVQLSNRGNVKWIDENGFSVFTGKFREHQYTSQTISLGLAGWRES